MSHNQAWRPAVTEESGMDVVVAGGGPAGCAAACAAARAGLRVVLIEQLGALGGLGTSGLVCAFDPMANGEEPLVGGFCKKVVDTLYARGGLGIRERPEIYWRAYHHWTMFNPEDLKMVLDEFLADAGVEVRFFTRVVGVEARAGDGIVEGVATHDVEGFKMLRARAYVDASGDAVVAHGAGARVWRAGVDSPRIMPPTLTQIMANVDWERLDREAPAYQWEAHERALAEGFFRHPTRLLPGMGPIGGTTGYLNGGHVFGTDPLSAKSLSEAMPKGRRIAREFLEFYRRYVPGCEKAETIATGALLGVRETRRTASERDLTLDDFLARRRFPDQIGRFNKHVDVHPYDSSPEEWDRFRSHQKDMRLGPGESFGLPYGMLVPKGWRNLWVAGRCAGTDVLMQGVVRVMPTCYIMGEAAGAAIGLALAAGCPAGQVDYGALRGVLLENGAIL